MGRDLIQKKRTGSPGSEIRAERGDSTGVFRPEDLPEIARNQEWKQASPGQREKVCRIIRDMARALLIKAGYNRDIVYRNIP